MLHEIDSKRVIAGRRADSLPFREFLGVMARPRDPQSLAAREGDEAGDRLSNAYCEAGASPAAARASESERESSD